MCSSFIAWSAVQLSINSRFGGSFPATPLERAAGRPYTVVVSSCRSFGVLVSAAAMLCLPGAARAQVESRVYRLPIPQTAVPSSVALSLSYSAGGSVAGNGGTATLGDWDVTVGVDSDHCEILCVYRRVRYATHLMPPVAEIRMYADRTQQPITLTVDPAGTRLPVAGPPVRVVLEPPYLPGRRAIGAVLVRECHATTISPTALASCGLEQAAEAAVLPVLPLRI
jgi:hypothetical protein